MQASVSVVWIIHVHLSSDTGSVVSSLQFLFVDRFRSVTKVMMTDISDSVWRIILLNFLAAVSPEH